MSLEERDPQQIILVILTFNQKDKTLRCLENIFATQAPAPQIVLWDNGSQDGTDVAIKSRYPQVHYHHHPLNLGVASGRNAAARLAIVTFQPGYLLFLDNDMEIEPGFIPALAEPFAGNPRLGQTQAKLRLQNDRSRLNDGGGCEINFILGSTNPVGFGEVDRGQYDHPRECIACGGAMLVRANVFEQLGGFDEIFSPFGPEDLDFSLRLQNAGYTTLYAPEAVAYHEVSHSFSDGYTENYARHKSKHWLIFLRRHASPLQKIGFYTIGAPYLLARMILREGRKGNLRALRGAVKGFLENKRDQPSKY